MVIATKTAAATLASASKIAAATMVTA